MPQDNFNQPVNCENCGACCRWAFEQVGLGYKLPELLRLRGAKLVNGYVLLPSRCSELDKNGRCSRYASRPQDCREFPVGGAVCLRCRAAEGII